MYETLTDFKEFCIRSIVFRITVKEAHKTHLRLQNSI